MTIQSVHSTKPDTQAAIAEIRDALSGLEPSFVLFFASPQHDPAKLAEGIQAAFAGARTMGCTTAGELTSGKMLDGAVVAMAFDAESLRHVAVEIASLDGGQKNVSAAIGRLAESVGQSLHALSHEKYVGLVLTDGLSLGEERVMEVIGDRTNVTFIGGSAGDDAAFEKTWVFVDGVAYSNATALALLEPATPFEVLKTQSFDVLPQTLKVTRVDEAIRTVHAFNDKPAAQAYAESLGTTVEELPSKFMSNPVGLMAGDNEPFVRSPQRLDGDSVVFYCALKPGMELSVLQSTDIVEGTQASLKGVLQAGPVSGLINFHCILRTLQLKDCGAAEAYGKIFAELPMVGFSTYGESYIGHINQTSTMLIFR